MARSPRRDERDRRGHDRDRRRSSRDRDDYVGSRYQRYSYAQYSPPPQRRHDHDRRDGRYDSRSYAAHDDGRSYHARDRKRDRETSPARDRQRDRSRDRYRHRDDHRDRDEREVKRARVEYEPPRRDEDGERSSRTQRQEGYSKRSEPGTSDAKPIQAENQEARLAKLNAWKQKKLLEKQQKNGQDGLASPTANAEGSLPAETSKIESSSSQVAAPTKKFDPKAIQRRAAAGLERMKQKIALGGDIAIPKSATNATSGPAFSVANNTKVASPSLSNGARNASTPASKISGFGLSTATTDTKDKSTAAKAAAPLGEEEEVARKLEKLPDMPTQVDTGDAALANDSEDQDESNEIQSDEEETEAARAEVQKRSENVLALPQEDTTMADAVPHAGVGAIDGKMDEDEEEDVDPLDAFMNGLEQPTVMAAPRLPASKNAKKQPQVFNSDDEEATLDAMGDDTDDIIAAAHAKRKKKEIPAVDHSKMDYEPFRKNFYSESVELANMTEDDLEVLRADLDNIKCRGVNVPKPILKWSQGGFGAQILDVIREQKFDKPTSVQSQALPAIMSGRDVIGIAKTGSGKTLAFILPMFRHIKDQRPPANMDGPIGLIIAPTRELATQIHRDCKPYLKALNLRAVCAYGGAPIKDQIGELKRGAEIVVCTAGRLIDLLAANSGRVLNLKRVTYVVLDEADRMFDMGFEPQITKVLNRIRPGRQTVLFSATFPRGMENLARKSLTKPIEILVGGRSVVASEITQVVEVCDEATKWPNLLKLIGDLTLKDKDARCLVFVEKQETADNIFVKLGKASYPSVSIHGGREQIDRDQAISDFKAGHYPIMIATSVAARGLDVKQLKLVVNYDAPNHIEDYVHRSGRTGRAGNTGTAVTFVTPSQGRYAAFLARALRDSKQEIPAPLQELCDAHEKMVKSGEAQKASSGFGGRGIDRLDAARDAEKARERKLHKGEDEPEEEEEKDEGKSKKLSEVDKLIAKAKGEGVTERDAPASIPTNLADKLKDAMKVQKADDSKDASSTSATGNKSKADKAKAAAAAVNKRLGAKANSSRPGPSADRGPDAGAFSATLEVNDFPQSARWKVTNRTNVKEILDNTGTSITNKGEFYPDGREPKEGELPKLYILVEGDTENVVETAMSQLTRLLKEGTIEAITNPEGRQKQPGRYTVT